MAGRGDLQYKCVELNLVNLMRYRVAVQPVIDSRA